MGSRLVNLRGVGVDPRGAGCLLARVRRIGLCVCNRPPVHAGLSSRAGVVAGGAACRLQQATSWPAASRRRLPAGSSSRAGVVAGGAPCSQPRRPDCYDWLVLAGITGWYYLLLLAGIIGWYYWSVLAGMTGWYYSQVILVGVIGW